MILTINVQYALTIHYKRVFTLLHLAIIATKGIIFQKTSAKYRFLRVVTNDRVTTFTFICVRRTLYFLGIQNKCKQ